MPTPDRLSKATPASLPGKQAAILTHKAVEQRAEEIKNERKDEQRPGVVFLVQEHRYQGQEERQGSKDGGIQQKGDQAHVVFQPNSSRHCCVPLSSMSGDREAAKGCGTPQKPIRCAAKPRRNRGTTMPVELPVYRRVRRMKTPKRV